MDSQDSSAIITVIGMEDAFNFFDMIRERFSDEPHYYKYFVSIIKEYKYGRVGIIGLVRRVDILFRSNPDLLHEFNKFLPPSYRIKITERSNNEE